VGVESLAEHLDVETTREIDVDGTVGEINACLPEGLAVIRLDRLDGGAPSLEDSAACVRYEVESQSLGDKASAALRRFEQAPGLPLIRVRGERRTEVDLKDYVAGLAVDGAGVLGIGVLNIRPALRISEVLGVLLDISGEEARGLPVKKVHVEWKSDAE
jgi:hypothetical protein